MSGHCRLGRFPRAYIRCKGLPPVIIRFRVIRLPVLFNEILNKRIGAGGVIRRIGQGQNVLVLANGESLDLSELRFLEFLAKLLQEIIPAFLIVFKGDSKAFDRSIENFIQLFFVREIAFLSLDHSSFSP